MELKERKRIMNSRLPGFENGLENGIGFGEPNYNITAPSYERTKELFTKNLQADDLKKPRPDLHVDNLDFDKIRSNVENFVPSVVNLTPWFSVASEVAKGVGTAVGAMNKDTDSMLMDAGRTSANVNGFGYEKQNAVDVDAQMKEYNAKTWGNGPIAGLVGLFGRNKIKRQIAEANRKANMINLFNRSGAASDYLTQQFNLKNGNTQDQTLYAQNGKDIQTSFGEVPMQPNARVEGQEIMYNKGKESAHIVPGPANGDNNLAYARPSDVILSNKLLKMFGLDSTVRPAAKALASINKNKNNNLRGPLAKQTDELITKQATAVLDEAAQLQADARAAGLLGPTKTYTAKNGKDCLPGFKLGSNWWVDGIGVLTGLGQFLQGALNRPKRSNIYAANPYENAALSEMAKLRINPYPIMDAMRQQERRNLYAINRAGGLSGAQKAFANIATGIGTQNNIAQTLSNIQQENNKYKANYAQNLLNAGQADRQARQAANQFDLDYYSRSHGARQQMIQMGLYNILGQLQQGYANAFKRNQFLDTMALYRQDQKLEKERIRKGTSGGFYRKNYFNDSLV